MTLLGTVFVLIVFVESSLHDIPYLIAKSATIPCRPIHTAGWVKPLLCYLAFTVDPGRRSINRARLGLLIINTPEKTAFDLHFLASSRLEHIAAEKRPAIPRSGI